MTVQEPKGGVEGACCLEKKRECQQRTLSREKRGEESEAHTCAGNSAAQICCLQGAVETEEDGKPNFSFLSFSLPRLQSLLLLGLNPGPIAMHYPRAPFPLPPSTISY